MGKLLNEIFTLEIADNKSKVTAFVEENEINRD